MKVKIKNLEGNLISINPGYSPYSNAYVVKMEYNSYEIIVHNVNEKDITIIMEK